MALENFGSELPSSSYFSCIVYGFAYIQAFVFKPKSNNWLFLAFSVIPSVI